MKIFEYSASFFLVVHLFSCTIPANQTVENPSPKDSVLCTKVVYGFSFEEEKGLGLNMGLNRKAEIVRRKSRSPQFIQELRKQHGEKDKTLYFDGQRSVTQQETEDYCVNSMTTEIRDTSPWATFHRTLSYLHFWGKYEHLQLPVNEKSRVETITFLTKEKEILNYKCQQVMIEDHSKLLLCWFTKDIKLKDATKAFFQHDSIPGTILEWDEYWVGMNYWNYIRTTTVKSIQEAVKVDPNLFEIPATAKKMDADQAGEQNFKLMVEASKKEKQLSAAEKSQYLGIWNLKIDNDGIQLEIKDLGNNRYEVTETDIEANRLTLHQTKKAAFYGGWLVVISEPYYIRYQLDNEGKLQQEQKSFYTYSKLGMKPNYAEQKLVK